MNGYELEFKRNYNISGSVDLERAVQIGYIDSRNITDPEDNQFVKNTRVTGNCDAVAKTIRPPGRSADIFAPINDVSNSAEPYCRE